jgi:hypothetical protein
MATFREMFFTPAEFANIAKVDRNAIAGLEGAGLLKTGKRKIGNVERKMVSLEQMQAYFRSVRDLRTNAPDLSQGDGATVGRRGDHR